MLVMKDKLWGLLIVDLFLYLLVRKGGLSKKSSNEVRMEFSVKNKTLAMTSKMHLALFSLASSKVPVVAWDLREIMEFE